MQLYLGEEGKKYYWRVADVSNIADVETLETKFELTEEMAEYVLDSNERARVEYDGKNLLVVIHVPAFTQNNGHYETRSINKSSKILQYAQSNLSARLKVLETELDTKLFYRKYNGLIPTESGDLFYQFCKETSNNLEKLKKKCETSKISI